MSQLTYEDYKSRLKMQDLLTDAGYAQNKRDGLRYPSYSRHDSMGRCVSGDKFVITPDGNYCFQPPVMKVYNVISFIKEHPDLFQDYTPGMDLNRLVNLVCSRLLNQPVEERPSQDYVPQHKQTFNLDDYALVHFIDDRTEQHKFFPFFVHRGINWYTQNAFRNYFVRATHLADSNPKQYANLSFPLTLPRQKEWVGFEERGMRRADGTAYKGKAAGSNSSEGLWIASPADTPLPEAKTVYWFESGYDAMAYYQLHQKADSQLREAVFVSTGGTPTVGQMRGMLAHTVGHPSHLLRQRPCRSAVHREPEERDTPCRPCLHRGHPGAQALSRFLSLSSGFHLRRDRPPSQAFTGTICHVRGRMGGNHVDARVRTQLRGEHQGATGTCQPSLQGLPPRVT